uniref:hypothetical protein n=1 Tax=Umezakia ovalisporum TaxID=75695 RepID=UPI0039C74FF8
LGEGSSTTQLNVYGASISLVPKSDENSTPNKSDENSTPNKSKVFHINRYKENKNIDMQSDKKENDGNSDLSVFLKKHDVPEDYISRCERAVSNIIQKAKEGDEYYFDRHDELNNSNMPRPLVTEAMLDRGVDFPKIAPEKWRTPGKGRHKIPEGVESPEVFALRVYGQWMRPDAPHMSIGMPEILHLDEPLYHALRRSNRPDKPEGYCLPSKKERNDAHLALVQSGSLGTTNAKELMRLSSAMAYRQSIKREKSRDY